MRLHNPRRCATCRSFARAVRFGEVTCIHAFAARGQCELCLNWRTVLGL